MLYEVITDADTHPALVLDLVDDFGEVLEAEAEIRRITSYNVCYTKLLRSTWVVRRCLSRWYMASLVRSPVAFAASDSVFVQGSGANNPYATGAGVPLGQTSPNSTSPTRITSYNVCYTKLLRQS